MEEGLKNARPRGTSDPRERDGEQKGRERKREVNNPAHLQSAEGK